MSSDAAVTISDSSKPDNLNADRAVVILRRVSATVLTVYMLWHSSAGDFTSIFQYHPMTMTLAFVSAMPEAVYASLSMKRARSLSDRHSAARKHFICSTLAGILTIAGSVAIYASKSSRNKQHLKTWHGLIGFIVALCVAVQTLSGAIVYFKLTTNGNILSRLRKLHKWLGIGILLSGALSMWLGMQSNFAVKTFPQASARLALAIALAVFPVSSYFLE